MQATIVSRIVKRGRRNQISVPGLIMVGWMEMEYWIGY